MAKVKKNDKVGFIDKAGKSVIGFNYDEAEDFKNRLSVVTIDDKLGFIDNSGNTVIPCEWDTITNLTGSIIKVEKNKKIAYYNIKDLEYIWKEEGF